MSALEKFANHILLAFAVMLLLAGCGRNSYRPMSHNFDFLLEGGAPIDTAFVAAMRAASAVEFDSAAINFLTFYDRDFDDPGMRAFGAGTPYLVRQDSLIFYMQDYLLNTYRYEESVELGRALDGRCAGALANTPLRSACLGDIAVAYFYLGNLDEAIKYQRMGYEIDTRLDEPQLMSSDLNQLAAMCLRSAKYDLARDYILEAIKVEEPLGRSGTLAIRYGLASEIYLKLKDCPTAAEYARKALDLDRQDGRDRKVGIRLSQLAAIQLAQNDQAGAQESLAQAIPLLESSNNVNSLAIAHCQLGELALSKGDNGQARQCFGAALGLCRSAGLKPIEKRALHGLWLSLRDDNPALGAQYLEHYAALSDSLGFADTDSQLATLKAEIATRELRMENERLEVQNRVIRIIIVGSAMLFLLLGLVGWLIYRSRASRHRLVRLLLNMSADKYRSLFEEGEPAGQSVPAATAAAAGSQPAGARPAAAAPQGSVEDRVFIGSLINVIYSLIGADKRTDTAEIASRMHISERTLSRKVQALAGESTVAFVNRVKIDKAKRMLDSGDATPLADIAMRCGFDDPAYFSRIFKQCEGISPTTYRRGVK